MSKKHSVQILLLLSPISPEEILVHNALLVSIPDLPVALFPPDLPRLSREIRWVSQVFNVEFGFTSNSSKQSADHLNEIFKPLFSKWFERR